MKRRLVYICDWLPPDFGAVGQYAMTFARDWARDGWDVTLVGLSTGESRREPASRIGTGTLEVIRVHRRNYERQKFANRMVWTILSNMLLLQRAYGTMRRADAVLFTGSPPLMLHFISLVNLLLRKRLIYRITDFHPECLIAALGRSGPVLDVLLRLTYFWRRRIDAFEVLGLDQARLLKAIGIPDERISLRRDPCPIVFARTVLPLPLPHELRNGSGVILYSGNWGVAHDDRTFIESYSQYRSRSSHGLAFWLNAVGAKADRVEEELRRRGTPFYRSNLVRLEELPGLLLAVDVHLITLDDPFVGLVLPSKVHACIESGKPIIFVGSESSDVHTLAGNALSPTKYRRVDVGDVEGLLNALQAMEHVVRIEQRGERVEQYSPSDRSLRSQIAR